MITMSESLNLALFNHHLVFCPQPIPDSPMRRSASTFAAQRPQEVNLNDYILEKPVHDRHHHHHHHHRCHHRRDKDKKQRSLDRSPTAQHKATGQHTVLLYFIIMKMWHVVTANKQILLHGTS